MNKYLFFITGTFFLCNIFAQGGGSPMITDDPWTSGKGNFELEFAFETEMTEVSDEFNIPLIDLDYGITENFDISVESAYTITKESGTTENDIGFVELELKYKFYENEEKKFYLGLLNENEIEPANKETEHFFALLIEKGLGKLTLGSNVGYTYLAEDEDLMVSSLLLGTEVAEDFVVMGEFAFETLSTDLNTNQGVVNFGLAYGVNDLFEIKASLGTGLFASQGNLKKTLISFLGIEFEF